MGIGIKTSTLSALAVAFTLATAAGAQAHDHFEYAQTDLSRIQERFEQLERESRLDLVPQEREGFLDGDRQATRAQERLFQQITGLLGQQGARLDLMRDQIIESMSIQYPDRPVEEIRAEARNWIRDYMLAQTAETQTETNKVTLPSQFAHNVRGCTQDGLIYQMSYNIALDFNALGSFGNDDMAEEEVSLFELKVLETNRHFSGITGTGDYMDALREMNNSLNYSMQRLTGGLIDSLPSEEINGETYAALMQSIINSTEDGIAANFNGVDIDVIVADARQLPGECGAAFRPEQEDQADAGPAAADNSTPLRQAATGYTRGSMQSALAQNVITPAYPSANGAAGSNLPTRPISPTPPSAYAGTTSDDVASTLGIQNDTTAPLHEDGNTQPIPPSGGISGPFLIP